MQPRRRLSHQLATRRVRCRILLDLPTRSRGDGPPAAAVDRGRLGSARGCGCPATHHPRHTNRGIRWRHRLRLHAHAGGPVAARRPGRLHPHRKLGELRRRAAGLHPRRAGPRSGRRHRLLIVAGRDPPGLPELALPGKRRRPGRWNQPAAEPGAQHRVLTLGNAVPGGAMQDLRRVRRWLCAWRGRRGRGTQAVGRRGARRQPHPCRGARYRGQPGRCQQRGDRAQRARATGAAAPGFGVVEVEAGRHRLHRGPWHRHSPG
ncbi:hypothetical protein MYBA111488_11970 [Mycobacterium basiliense]